MMQKILLLAVFGIRLAAAGTTALADSTNHWGYGYDSLLRDLGEWRKSPFVKVDSIGASVEGRAIWMVSITDSLDSLGPVDDASSIKRRVMIHARTHPAEVQAQYVANEAIRSLLDTGSKAEELRRGFVFNIIPMYNPDGVELGHARQNAHGIDLESNWDDLVLEPEVVALKRLFERFMAGPLPVEVALNLHSDQYSCARFFWFHYAIGTSQAYEELQKKYIQGVQRHFADSIMSWDYRRSWATGTAPQYPESFWWTTFREKVLALTYEDTNCPGAGHFDSTGRALVLGSVDYIRDRMMVSVRPIAAAGGRLSLLREGVRLAGGGPGGRWELSDLQGRRLAGGPFGSVGALIAWKELPAAPVRILSVSRPGAPAERIRLPFRPD